MNTHAHLCRLTRICSGLTASFLILSPLSNLRAGDAVPASSTKSPTVFAECRMVVVPQKAMLSLVSQFSDDSKADAAWEKIEQMIETGEATLAADLVVKGAENEALQSETNEEVRYPTDYQPTLPDKVPQDNPVEYAKHWPGVALTPAAMETRNTGPKIKLIMHSTGEPEIVEAEIEANHDRLLRWQKIESGKLSNGDPLNVEQPCFHSMRDTLKMRLRLGQRVLIGVHKVPDAEKTFELFLLRTAALPSSGH